MTSLVLSYSGFIHTCTHTHSQMLVIYTITYNGQSVCSCMMSTVPGCGDTQYVSTLNCTQLCRYNDYQYQPWVYNSVEIREHANKTQMLWLARWLTTAVYVRLLVTVEDVVLYPTSRLEFVIITSACGLSLPYDNSMRDGELTLTTKYGQMLYWKWDTTSK